MPTTSNFGWTTPADTDLVKNGALAIRTLGNGIDTSMAELKGGTTGQVLSKTSNTDMDFTWVTTDDANAIQNAIVDAKGDLIAATANDTPARLAVGNNGETLVADSSTSTGLRWQSNFAAGKNVLINGDLRINQRNFTSNTADNAYNFDRFSQSNGGSSGTLTITPQNFTAGAAPVSGYEGSTFMRCVTAAGASANTYAIINQPIENVRILAGQTATLSFWAKAGSGTPKVAFELKQNFGSGGSPSAEVLTYAGQVTLSTSWTRYSITVSVPSLSGKTVGTTANTSFSVVSLWLSSGSDYNARNGTLGLQNATFDFWGFQFEAGNVATAFQTATGTLAGELAACQRYFYAPTINDNVQGAAYSTTAGYFSTRYPVSMRVTPTATYPTTFTNIVGDLVSAVNRTPTAVVNYVMAGTDYASWAATGMTGLTAGSPLTFRTNITWSAEL